VSSFFGFSKDKIPIENLFFSIYSYYMQIPVSQLFLRCQETLDVFLAVLQSPTLNKNDILFNQVHMPIALPPTAHLDIWPLL